MNIYYRQTLVIYTDIHISETFNLFLLYLTTITKQVLQLILIMLIGTDVCVHTVFVWGETGVPGGNPPVCGLLSIRYGMYRS